ncbi:BPL-N domain-containing protein [Bacteroidota bacterium]
MKKKNQILIFNLIVIISLLFLSCEKENDPDFPPISIDSVSIGLYIDNAAWSGLRTPTLNIVKETGFPYTIITNDSIINGNLDKYSVLFLTAGRGDRYWENLGQKGYDNIINYVRRGGGYIGICGSAHIACDRQIFWGFSGEPRTYGNYDGMSIFSGIGEGPIETFAPSYRDENCNIIIVNKTHPVSNNLPDTITYVYDHGPEFIPYDNEPAIIIGETEKGKHALIIAPEYYQGRIFFTSGHPEMANNEINRKLIENAINWCSK